MPILTSSSKKENDQKDMHIKLNNIVKKLDTPIEQLCLNTFKLRTTKKVCSCWIYNVYDIQLGFANPKDKNITYFAKRQITID